MNCNRCDMSFVTQRTSDHFANQCPWLFMWLRSNQNIRNFVITLATCDFSWLLKWVFIGVFENIYYWTLLKNVGNQIVVTKHVRQVTRDSFDMCHETFRITNELDMATTPQRYNIWGHSLTCGNWIFKM